MTHSIEDGEDPLATECKDTRKQFEHKKATETEADTVEYIVDPLPFAVVKAFFAAVFASDIIVSRPVRLFPEPLSIDRKATPIRKNRQKSHICKLIKKSAKMPEISSDTRRMTL